MNAIFINYRRDDTSGHANRIYSDSAHYFGESSIFFDSGAIGPGDDWDRAIKSNLYDCEILIAVIGKRWLTERLADPNDYVRLEIRTALQRAIDIIPVLVDGAALPDINSLPDDIQGLLHKQALRLSDNSTEDYRHEMDRLIQRIQAKVKRTGLIKLERRLRYIGALTKFLVIVHDQQIGTISNHSTQIFNVKIGTHKIYVESAISGSWFFLGQKEQSAAITVRVSESKTAYLECGYETLLNADGFGKIYIREVEQ